MEKELVQGTFNDVAAEVCKTLVREGLKAPFWIECYDDRGHGFVCGFQMEKGLGSRWSWRPAIADAEWPIGMVLTDQIGEHRKVWVRGPRLWTAA